MENEMKFDDDNMTQLGEDSFAVVNYDEDTLFIIGHSDTIINDKHIVTDTFIKHDTIYIETITFDKEIEIIEKIMDRPDFGKSAVSILILVFVLYSVWKKWSCKKEK
tara:strand:- start:233 stop:553 length:321 start_codon:yes stop_codon:yes gene_type:complete